MYESIQGILVRREPALAIVRASGLAYQLHIPLSTYEALPPAGAEVELLLHLSVREDEWRLFAFSSEEERGIFRAVTRVSGVGPVIALSMLSGFRPAELRAAVAQEDVRTLTRAKGVGKKTAERIVVELRDLWKGEQAAESAGLPSAVVAGPAEDAVRALESLGLDTTEASKRIGRLLAAEGAEELDTATLIRRALRG